MGAAFRHIRRFSWLLAVLLLCACGQDEQDTNRLDFGQFRWPSFPVSIEPASSLQANGGFRRDLRAAMKFWEQHAGRPLFKISGTWTGRSLPYTGAANNPSSITANVVLFGDAGALEPNIAGLTSLRVYGGEITGAVVIIDPDTRFCTGSCDGDWSAPSLRCLIAHELGHFLGLGHSPDPENIMFPRIRLGRTLRDSTVDEVELKRLTE